MSIMSKASTGKFTEHYKEEIFTLWYNAGKPTFLTLYQMIESDKATGDIPAQSTLQLWIRDSFRPRAEHLDEQVMQQMEARLIAEKVKMLSRHAETSLKMQNISLTYLESDEVTLTTSSAIRLLVEGIRIERDSRGLPEAMSKMINMTDDELLEEINRLALDTSEIKIEPND